MIPSNNLILCHPLLLLPSIFPRIRVFSNESALHIRWPKYWSFSFSISPSNEYWKQISFRAISFRMDWLDLLAVQGTLKSLLQHHSSKATILWHSAFFIVQLSHPYMTTRKIIALPRWAFVGKVLKTHVSNELVPGGDRWKQDALSFKMTEMPFLAGNLLKASQRRWQPSWYSGLAGV